MHIHFTSLYYYLQLNLSLKLQCYYGHHGESSNETIIAPIIFNPSVTFELVEGESFSYQLKLEQGSTPVEWSLVGVPIPGMTINLSTGMLSWELPPAKSTFYYMKVQATNELTQSATIQLAFHVSPSYYVAVSTDLASFIHPSPAVYFDFMTRDLSTLDPVGEKLAVLWVYKNGTPSGQHHKTTVKMDAFGRFRDLYQPYSTDAGTFLYGGEHPAHNNLTVQGQINIMGIDVTPKFCWLCDAWLTAVEGQLIEEAKQLAGVYASVRVQIELEFTWTRVGFEAHVEILNSGNFLLENITGEYRYWGSMQRMA